MTLLEKRSHINGFLQLWASQAFTAVTSSSPKRMAASGPSSISDAEITPSWDGRSGWSHWSRSSRRFAQRTGSVLWNLKDAYFHIQIAPHHRRFLRFAFEGVAYQYTVLPFGLSLAPRTFTKCMDAALSPLRQMGIPHSQLPPRRRAHSGPVRGGTTFTQNPHPQPLRAPGGSGSISPKAHCPPSQRISFLGTVLDSAHMRAVIAPELALAIQNSRPPSRATPLAHSKCFRECWSLWPQHRQCYSWACSACAPFNAGWNHGFHTTHGVTDACISGWIRPV